MVCWGGVALLRSRAGRARALRRWRVAGRVVDLLRNTLVAASLSEHRVREGVTLSSDSQRQALTEALFAKGDENAIDQVEPLVIRYREIAKAKSRAEGRVEPEEFGSLPACALLHQARGRPEEAGGDVRALLALYRENKAVVQANFRVCRGMLHAATIKLTILDGPRGDRELINEVNVIVAMLNGMDGGRWVGVGI